jgi:hypothetical protein
MAHRAEVASVDCGEIPDLCAQLAVGEELSQAVRQWRDHGIRTAAHRRDLKSGSIPQGMRGATGVRHACGNH